MPDVVEANASEGGVDYLASMSREAIDRIGTLFAEDFQLFGYERK